MDQSPDDRTGWTARIGQPFVPPHLQRAEVRPAYGANQLRAMHHAALLMLSPILIWLGGVLTEALTSDFLVDAPPVADLWPFPLLAGLALWFTAGKGVAPNLCRWLGLVGWIATGVVALLYPAASFYARAHAAPGPELRSQISKFETRGGRFKTTMTTFALQDGSSVETKAYPAGEYGSMGRCLAVRRLAGPFGFIWLQVTEAAPLPPAPGPGQLAWPVEPVSRVDCFSHKPLSELRATT
ncbi:hypothetical protein SH591_02760 [Sphingomonas sp. LY54]|uniref:hypothetical protein n=1 Tax=Sphingomonas sp. LY54 TaxID=3095343 RepID=UPI002D78BB3E|nr:hypothetical protein [Sphingomonas sp. LY54]WRP29120.1 hypothetical protein SH591_02760 [Sphingomonas sp. LY54]